MTTQAASGTGRTRWLPIVAVPCLLLAAGEPGRALAREETIGATTRVISEVHGILGRITRELVIDDDVFSQEIIETGNEGATRIVFLDGTELSMGPNSEVTLDRYVYDPNTGAGAMVVNFVNGIFEFASGLIPHSGYDLRTPFANLAIRGTTFTIVVPEESGAPDQCLELSVEDDRSEVALEVDGREVGVLNDAFQCLRLCAGGLPTFGQLTECQMLAEGKRDLQAKMAAAEPLRIEPAAGPFGEFLFTPLGLGIAPRPDGLDGLNVPPADRRSVLPAEILEPEGPPASNEQ